MSVPTPSYVYRASLVRVVDGDTLVLDISLGVHVYTTREIRLLGLDTPEKIGPTRVAGLAATQATRDWCAAAALANQDTAWPLVVATTLDKADKYGRLLGVIYARGNDISLNQSLLERGFALPYDGGARA